MVETCQKASAIWGNEVNSYPPISLSAGGIGKKKDEVLMHKVATIILKVNKIICLKWMQPIFAYLSDLGALHLR